MLLVLHAAQTPLEQALVAQIVTRLPIKYVLYNVGIDFSGVREMFN
jgi:hypothetical protein